MNSSTFFKGQVLWSQVDANRHLRHSAYADFATQARSNMLKEYGLTLEDFAKKQIGPILFREELHYFREVRLDDYIYVDVQVAALDPQSGRFSIVHQLYKSDDTLAATIHIDGAWLNLLTRKRCSIPEAWLAILEQLPKSNEYKNINESSEI